MIAQVLSATKYSLLSFRRSPAATFFTIAFPLIFLVIFGFIFGDEITDDGTKVATFQVPGILALSIVSATFVNLAMVSVIRREAGQLKRLRGTPMRPIVWVAGQILASFVIVIIMCVLVILLGQLLFGVAFQVDTIAIFAVTVLLGSVAFSALGLAISAIIPSEDAAPAITNAVVLPLYFVSDVFLYTGDSSGFIAKVGDYFPIKPLAQSLQPSFHPFIEGADIPWSQWAVIAAWGLGGVALAARFFLWVPKAYRD